MRFLFLAVFLFCTSFVCADVLSELAQASRANPEVVMEISQTKRVSFFNETIKSKLLVVVSASGKMRMQTLEPFEAVSIFDGDVFARFEKIDGVWKRLDSSGVVAKRIFEEIRGLFSGTVSRTAYDITNKSADVIALAPKSSEVRKAVASIEIFTRLENGLRLVDKISILDADGDTTILQITNLRKATLGSEVFDVEKLSDFSL